MYCVFPSSSTCIILIEFSHVQNKYSSGKTALPPHSSGSPNRQERHLRCMYPPATPSSLPQHHPSLGLEVCQRYVLPEVCVCPWAWTTKPSTSAEVGELPGATNTYQSLLWLTELKSFFLFAAAKNALTDCMQKSH